MGITRTRQTTAVGDGRALACVLVGAMLLATACRSQPHDGQGETRSASATAHSADLFTQLKKQASAFGLLDGMIDRVRDIGRPWTVEKLAAEYAVALQPERRRALVYLLAASEDRRGLIVAGKALGDSEVQHRAADAIMTFWVGNARFAMGSQTSLIYARNYWEGRREELTEEERKREVEHHADWK